MLTIKLFSNYIPKPEMPLWAEKLGAAFLVSGLVLGIIGATVSATAIALSAVGMAKVRRASK